MSERKVVLNEAEMTTNEMRLTLELALARMETHALGMLLYEVIDAIAPKKGDDRAALLDRLRSRSISQVGRHDMPPKAMDQATRIILDAVPKS